MAARAALTGCVALLQRRSNTATGAAAPTAATAVLIVQRFLQHILVQAFGQPERMLAYELLETAVEVRMPPPTSWHCQSACVPGAVPASLSYATSFSTLQHPSIYVV